MVNPKRVIKAAELGTGFLPMPVGADDGSKCLIAAVLAAGKDGCKCDSCKLLRRFGASMSEAMLKEVTNGGD
jgi:hypothetical protein